MNLTAHPRPIRVGMGLAGSLVVAGLIVVSVAFGQGYFDKGYELTAVFPTASQGLFADGATSVRMRGVAVGHVSGIELLDDGRAEVRLFIDDGVRVPTSATALIEPLSIFGPKMVRLDPGEGERAGPFLGPGDVIERTSTQRELSDILEATTELFSQVDPTDVVTVLDAVTEGVDGLGDELGTTIDASAELAPVGARHADDLRAFLGDATVLTGVLADHGDDLLAIGQDLEVIVDTALDDPAALDGLLATTIGISTTFADLLRSNQADLGVTIESVAAFLRDVRIESHQIPELLDLVGTFFGRLSDIIRLPGPGDTQMAALRGFASLDLCLVYGLCLGEEGLADAAAGGVPVAAASGAPATEARLAQALAHAERPTGALAEMAAVLTGAEP